MDDLLAAARRLATMVRETRDYGEQHRHLEPGVLAAMHDARLFRTLIPKQFGGLQTDPMTAMEVVETILTADGAAGWNLMIGSAYGVWAARLPADVARTIYGKPDAVVAGALRPSGKAPAASRSPAASATAPGGPAAACWRMARSGWCSSRRATAS